MTKKESATDPACDVISKRALVRQGSSMVRHVTPFDVAVFKRAENAVKSQKNADRKAQVGLNHCHASQTCCVLNAWQQIILMHAPADQPGHGAAMTSHAGQADSSVFAALRVCFDPVEGPARCRVTLAKTHEAFSLARI